MTVTFKYSELTDFFREINKPTLLEKHTLKTIETIKIVGIDKLTQILNQNAIPQELYEKFKQAAQNNSTIKFS